MPGGEAAPATPTRTPQEATGEASTTDAAVPEARDTAIGDEPPVSLLAGFSIASNTVSRIMASGSFAANAESFRTADAVVGQTMSLVI